MCKGNILIQIFMKHILCLRQVIDIIPCAANRLPFGVDIFIGERRLIQRKRAALQTDGANFRSSSLLREVCTMGANFRT